MKFRKKSVVIDASQWLKNGDHPADDCGTFEGSDGKPLQSEGHGVRYYRDPDDDGKRVCAHCGNIMHLHGWIDTLEGGHKVCPADWIITGVKGEKYPCKPDIFEATYEAVKDDKGRRDDKRGGGLTSEEMAGLRLDHAILSPNVGTRADTKQEALDRVVGAVPRFLNEIEQLRDLCGRCGDMLQWATGYGRWDEAYGPRLHEWRALILEAIEAEGVKRDKGPVPPKPEALSAGPVVLEAEPWIAQCVRCGGLWSYMGTAEGRPVASLERDAVRWCPRCGRPMEAMTLCWRSAEIGMFTGH